jgi:hypothetical protein
MVVRDHTLPKRPWRLYTMPFDELLSHPYKGSGTDSDPFVVDWLANDREDPQQWPVVYKWIQIFIVSILTLCVALASSAWAGGIKSLFKEFGGSSELWTGGVCECLC